MFLQKITKATKGYGSRVTRQATPPLSLLFFAFFVLFRGYSQIAFPLRHGSNASRRDAAGLCGIA
jgi:hypothetical protein